MAYDPKAYIPDFSWMASAGRAVADTILKMPAAVEADKAFRENKVTKDEVYTGLSGHIKSIPPDVLEKSGLSLDKLTKTMPAPKKTRGEDVKGYTRRLTAWYIPIVETLQRAGATPEQIQGWVAEAPQQVGLGQDATVKGAIGAAKTGRDQDIIQEAALGKPGMMFGPEGGANVGDQPVPADQPQQMVPMRDAPIRDDVPTNQQEYMGAIGEESKSRGVTGPDAPTVKKSTQYESFPPAEKPMTEYQKANLERLIAAGVSEKNKKTDSTFFKESTKLLDEAESWTGTARLLEGKGKDAQAVLDETMQRLPELMEEMKLAVGDQKAQLEKERSKIQADREKARNTLITNTKEVREAKRNRDIQQLAYSMYVKADGSLSFGDAKRRAESQIDEGEAPQSVAPIGGPAKPAAQDAPAAIGGGTTPTVMPPQDKQAYDWAQANPTDPRAQKIIESLKAKGLI